MITYLAPNNTALIWGVVAFPVSGDALLWTAFRLERISSDRRDRTWQHSDRR